MQPVPEGYKPLGFAGFTDKGTYTASEVYAKNDIVHNNNTTWRCLVNGTTGIIPAEGANWTIFIASESDSSGITTTDTEGLVGPAGEKVSNQSLIDAIAEKVAKQLVTNASLTNALAGYITKEMMSSDQTDDPDKVPTSALAYAMQQSIDELNGNFKIGAKNIYDIIDLDDKIEVIESYVKINKSTVDLYVKIVVRQVLENGFFGTTKPEYKPAQHYTIFSHYSADAPYNVSGSFWVGTTGTIRMYSTATNKQYYINARWLRNIV